VFLEPNERLYAVAFRETCDGAVFVLVDPPREIVGHSDVESPITAARQHVDVEGHGASHIWAPAFAGEIGRGIALRTETLRGASEEDGGAPLDLVEALVGGELVPLRGEGEVLRHAPAVRIEKAEVELGVRRTLVGGELEPPGRLEVVLLHALAVEVD